MFDDCCAEVKVVAFFSLLYIGYNLYNNFKSFIIIILLFIILLIMFNRDYIRNNNKLVNEEDCLNYDNNFDEIDIGLGNAVSILDNSWYSAGSGPKDFLAPVNRYDNKIYDSELVGGFSDYVNVPQILRGKIDDDKLFVGDVIFNNDKLYRGIVNPNNVNNFVAGPAGLYF